MVLQPLFTGTAGEEEGKGRDCPSGSGLQEYGKEEDQCAGWASTVQRDRSGLSFGPHSGSVLSPVLCVRMVAGRRPSAAAAAAAAGPAAWPRCSAAACRPVSGTLAAGSMPLGSGKPGPGVPIQCGNSLQLSGNLPKSDPLESWWLPARRPHPPKLHPTAHWTYQEHHGAASHSQPPWLPLQRPGH